MLFGQKRVYSGRWRFTKFCHCCFRVGIFIPNRSAEFRFVEFQGLRFNLQSQFGRFDLALLLIDIMTREFGTVCWTACVLFEWRHGYGRSGSDLFGVGRGSEGQFADFAVVSFNVGDIMVFCCRVCLDLSGSFAIG